MAAEYDDLLGVFGADDLADDVGGDLRGLHVGLHLEVHLDGLAFALEAGEHEGVFDGDSGGGNLRLFRVVLQGAGVRQLHGERGDGADEYADGAEGGGLRGSGDAVHDGAAVAHVGRVVDDDLALDAGAAEFLERVEVGHDDDFGGEAFGRGGDALPRPSRCRGLVTGATIAPDSCPRTQWGTVAAWVWTLARPSRFISSVAQEMAVSSDCEPEMRLPM